MRYGVGDTNKVRYESSCVLVIFSLTKSVGKVNFYVRGSNWACVTVNQGFESEKYGLGIIITV